ncbi:MAG TPA: hypothetical protein VK356_09585, partial [Thermomicrobiales bacterium]|nr:hypothetical protein [Thermomicrobiales bacterium]
MAGGGSIISSGTGLRVPVGSNSLSVTPVPLEVFKAGRLQGNMRWRDSNATLPPTSTTSATDTTRAGSTAPPEPPMRARPFFFSDYTPLG